MEYFEIDDKRQLELFLPNFGENEISSKTDNGDDDYDDDAEEKHNY